MSDWSDMPKIMKVADRNNEGVGQLVMLVLPPLNTVIQDIWDTAQTSNLVHFESFKQRAKATPAQAG
ncbi:MAG: hypothetical protein F6K42_19495 [Leptolyngbya sp. SIO1D8]|nr:hypothetical protein [Leptolyngbya sp. SIO1D8]